MHPPALGKSTATESWQHQLANAFTDVFELCRYLNLTPDDLDLSPAASQQFPLKVPKDFADRMEKGNSLDPLLLQVLPVISETFLFPGYSNDPVGDLPALTSAHVLHKYHGRVLLINTGVCAINCRYCFRRNFPYADVQLSKQKQSAALHYVENNTDISEVILSGGDPLLLSDERLTQLLKALQEIDHVKRIRIHSRIPVVLPARITNELLSILTNTPKQMVLVIHCNHPNELSRPVSDLCLRLKQTGVTLLNQSVLLKQINDSTDVLAALSEKLFAAGVIPYYLHLLDKAQGTGHFEVSEHQALRIMQALQGILPGYLVPRLVKEVPGTHSKQAIFGA